MTETMLAPTWDHPDKMHVDSGHRTWDAHANCVSYGNILANGWRGSHIRAFNTSQNPVGTPCEPGAMQKWDLDHFPFLSGNYGIRLAVEKTLEPDQGGLLYCAYGPAPHVVHGFILTGEGDHPLLGRFDTGPTSKSSLVIDWCVPRVTGRRR